jgi:hypothetical protein
VKAIWIVSVVLLAACTDAQMGKLSALGGSAIVKCWSAENVIFEGQSTGKVARADGGSDGYYFVDAADGKLKEVSGNCVVTYSNY